MVKKYNEFINESVDTNFNGFIMFMKHLLNTTDNHEKKRGYTIGVSGTPENLKKFIKEFIEVGDGLMNRFNQIFSVGVDIKGVSQLDDNEYKKFEYNYDDCMDIDEIKKLRDQEREYENNIRKLVHDRFLKYTAKIKGINLLLINNRYVSHLESSIEDCGIVLNI